MYVAKVPNRNSPPAYLLRQGYREGGKVKNRTLANLSHLPIEQIEALRAVLKGDSVAPQVTLADAFEITRSRPHGAVAAVLGTARRIGLHAVIEPTQSRRRDLCLAMICERILEPRSKLHTATELRSATLHSTLGETLGLERADEDDLYQAMDWLYARQPRIEAVLAAKHLEAGALVLYDVSSSYVEGRHCPLAKRGYPRDPQRGKEQIVYGLLASAEGCPVAVEVFEGNTADPTTLAAQVGKLIERFGLTRVVVVGDRGMITDARIKTDLRPAGLEWISALRSPAIAKLVRSGDIQPTLFDIADLAQITHPDYPGERLVVCRNPLLAAERARKRAELLSATEAELEKIRTAVRRERRPLRGADKIGLRVGKVIGRYKMAKHFVLTITDAELSFRRDDGRIVAEQGLDGIYVIRTSLKELAPAEVVAAYKSLAQVEHAFRSLKTVDLKVRPIFHRKAERVKAHVFICMLAYYVEWHMRRELRPLLFDDEDPAAGQALRSSPVAPAKRSPSALRKIGRKRGEDGLPVQSFQSLLRDLATVVRNRIQPKTPGVSAFDMLTTPTKLQQRAFDLLGVKPSSV